MPIVVYNIRWAFAVYAADKKLWKVLLHTTGVICLGLLIVDLSLFCLRIQYDQFQSRISQFSVAKVEPQPGLQAARPAPKPTRAAPAQRKPGPKK
ncbi:MAG: hypothetical protein NTY77_20110 [Elusimicrobia bacterium]|nr:hypothetical protein [Elusimicrobiota bacterium]